MSAATVGYEVSDGLARIVLNRPPVNALDLDMIQRVVAALENAGKDERVRAVLLTSAIEKRFCAGLDLGILIGKSESKVRGFLSFMSASTTCSTISASRPSRWSPARRVAAA